MGHKGLRTPRWRSPRSCGRAHPPLTTPTCRGPLRWMRQSKRTAGYRSLMVRPGSLRYKRAERFVWDSNPVTCAMMRCAMLCIVLNRAAACTSGFVPCMTFACTLTQQGQQKAIACFVGSDGVHGCGVFISKSTLVDQNHRNTSLLP